MTTTQRIRVAEKVMRMAEDLGKRSLFQTSDDELAELMAHTLTNMVVEDKPEDIARTVDTLIKARDFAAPTVDQWAFMCMFTNWLSWAWHAEERDDLSEAWAKGWYRLNDYSLSNLKGDELSRYIQEVD